MKPFLKRTILYGSVVLAITISLYGYWAMAYRSSRIPMQKSKLLGRLRPGGSIILGSSFALHGIDPNRFGEGCLNLSAPDQTLYEDFEILKQAGARAELDHVILAFGLFTNHLQLKDIKENGEYLRIHDYEDAYGIPYPKDLRYYTSFIDLIGQIGRRALATRKPDDRLDEQGNLMTTCTGEHHDISRPEVPFDRHLVGKDFSKRNIHLDSIARYCERHGTKLYIVLTPLTRGYRDLIEARVPEYGSFLQGLRRMGPLVRVLDHQAFITVREEEYFADTYHLAPCGKELFSAALAEEIARDRAGEP